ncbi:condensation domain-containing protein [Streptacidiphilus sp. PAMC 29251]
MARKKVHEVHFNGSRSAEAPLTWGQRAIWQSIHWAEAQAQYFNIARVMRVDLAVQVEAALRGISELISLHEVLRTRFPGIGESLRQVVHQDGVLEVDIIEGDGTDAKAVADELASRVFVPADEWPIRCVLFVNDGVVTGAAFAYSHLAVDHIAVMVLERDLLDLWAAKSVAPPAWSPVDQAAYEASEAGRRRGEQALDYWRRSLRTAPTCLFGTDTGERGESRFVRLGMESRAVAVAATRIAERCRVSSSTVLLTSVATVLAQATGRRQTVMQLIAANRQYARSRSLVAQTAENALFSLDTRDTTFEELVQRSLEAATLAYRFALYDPYEVKRLVKQGGSGVPGQFPDLSAYFNDARIHDRWQGLTRSDVAAADLRRLTEETEVQFVGSWARQDASFFVHTSYAPETCRLYLMADTAKVPRTSVEALLRSMETVLVEAAEDPTVTVDRLTSALSLPTAASTATTPLLTP